jgi:phosphoribosylanthranilate isomerase
LIIEEGVKRDIVYVIFQAFAYTEVEYITVTAIPKIIQVSGGNHDEYMRALKSAKYLHRRAKTISISRAMAMELLEKHTAFNDFKVLYSYEHGSYVPNQIFDELKYSKLNTLFSEMEYFQKNR